MKFLGPTLDCLLEAALLGCRNLILNNPPPGDSPWLHTRVAWECQPPPGQVTPHPGRAPGITVFKK